MSLRLLEQLSLPGDLTKPNEDSFAYLDGAALVIDGATPLGPPLLPGQSDAAWIAQFGARRLAAHLKDGDQPLEALKHALEDAERSFAGLARAPVSEKWQLPCAAMMMAVELSRHRVPPLRQTTLEEELPPQGSLTSKRSSEIEFLWFGDCAALIEQKGQVEIVGEAIKNRKEESERAKRAAQKKNLSSALGVNRPEIEPLLRAARNRINSGGNWLFSPDPRAAKHVSRRTVRVEDGTRLLLVSDGFLALISDYHAYDAPGLIKAAAEKGLATLGEELRAIERKDAGGSRFFRFKVSDDATALYFQLI